jgi:hypothetical protein
MLNYHYWVLIFALVVNFWGINWESKHITIDFLEVNEFLGQTLVNNL